MARWLILVGLTAGVAMAGPSVRRPAVDAQAMREAMVASRVDEGRYASASSYAHFLLARLYHHDGNHQRAKEQLRLALATDDGNAFLLTALAEEQARLGDLPRAERTLRSATEAHPEFVPAQLLMGRVLLEAKKVASARVHLAKAIRLRPGSVEPYLVLMQLLLDEGQPDDAMGVADLMAVAQPSESVGYRRLGFALAERGDLTRAEPMLKKALEREPDHFETLSLLGHIYEATGRPLDAAIAYSRALEREPDSLELLLDLGKLALSQGELGAARLHLDRLLAQKPSPEWVVKTAFAYLSEHQLEAAVDVLDAATEAGASELRLFFYAGLVHERLGHYRKAAASFGRVTPEAGELHHEAKLHRASCLSRAGAHRAALELFRKSLVERPNDLSLIPPFTEALARSGAPAEAESYLLARLSDGPAAELYESLTELYEGQGRLGDAILVLRAALAKSPRDEGLHYLLGATYEKDGNVAQSLEHMRAVLDVNPDNAMAMNFIGYLLAVQGQSFDEAERLVSRALELKPDTGAFVDSLGWLYFRRGDTERALATLERARALAPFEPTICEHLGDAYARAEQPSAAATAYRRALEAIDGHGASPALRAQRASIERKLKTLSSESAGR